MLAAVLLFNLWFAPDSIPEPAPLTRAEPATVVVHRQPSVPIVALRLSLLANDPPGYAGAGHLIQHLIYPSLQDRAARVGGAVEIQRTADALVYTATGPATELDYLAGLLTSTLYAPDAPLDAMLRVSRELREERLAEWETAPGHARSMLRAQLFPSDISAAGTDRSAARLTGGVLPAVWRAMYQPDRVAVVAVGDVDLQSVRRAFATLPDPPSAPSLGLSRDSIVLGPLAPPQATRAWVGVSYLVGDADPATASILARLLGERVRSRLPSSAQVESEHWWTHHGQAITLLAAVPGPSLGAARTAVNTAVGNLEGNLDFLSVTAAANSIRRELLFYSRRPDRMADVIGQFVDRSGDSESAEAFYRALERADDEDVRDLLEQLADQTPARVEIPPQVLQQRR